MNRAVLIGRLTADPELRFIPGTGRPTSKVTVAVDRRRANAEGQREADFIPVVMWGKQAEALANYMVKGGLIAVSGRIKTGSYEAKDGTRRYTMEVVADEVKFLSRPKGQTLSGSGNFDNEAEPVDPDDNPF